jgi:hypothetical protein
MTALLVATGLLGAPGCGGGGAAGTLQPLPPVNAQQLAQDIVGACVQSSLDEVLALRGVLEAGAAGGVTPGFRVIGVDLSNVTSPGLTWASDLDGDALDDAQGTLSLGGLNVFQIAALVGQLSAPDADVAAILAGLPTGTTLRNVFTASMGDLQAAGDVVVSLVNPTGTQALPDRSTGSITTTDALCAVTWSWTNLLLSDLLAGPYPVATIDLSVDSPMGDLTGVLRLNGTVNAALETYLQPSGVRTDFNLDLDTGELSLLGATP